MMQAHRRTLELATAAAVALFGAIIATDSLHHDIGWQANGPGSGYFPFRVGLLLMAASTLLFVQAARSPAGAIFVSGDGFRRSFSVFWPTTALAAAMFVFGCYVPSAIYLTWMMRRHGSYPWGRSAASALVIMALLFVIFEYWFQVPLAKGPIEMAVGLY